MVGGTISPPIFRAAIRMVVPGSTSMEILSIVTFNNFCSSAIYYVSQGAGCHCKDDKCLNYFPRRSTLITLCYCHIKGIGIMGQTKISTLCFNGICDVPFKFIPEMPYSGSHRPGRSITQRANGI